MCLKVCEGLLEEFLVEGIPTWPGYLDTLPLSLENLHTKLEHHFLLNDTACKPQYNDFTTEINAKRMSSVCCRYDEMGVLFTVLVSETTLKNGLLLVRNRDTTVRETMHISEIKGFLLRYICASENL